MNETLRQVLAELPEIMKNDLSVVAKYLDENTIFDGTRIKDVYYRMRDALQAAADEIERLKIAIERLKIAREDGVSFLKDDNKRLQAEIEQKNAALSIYADDSNWSSDWGWKGINDPTLIAKRELGGNQG